MIGDQRRSDYACGKRRQSFCSARSLSALRHCSTNALNSPRTSSLAPSCPLDSLANRSRNRRGHRFAPGDSYPVSTIGQPRSIRQQSRWEIGRYSRRAAVSLRGSAWCHRQCQLYEPYRPDGNQRLLRYGPKVWGGDPKALFKWASSRTSHNLLIISR
jgi:hypothetical protein